MFASDVQLGNFSQQEWEIYFSTKHGKQEGVDDFFKGGLGLFGEEASGMKALDIGCGVGFEAAYLLDRGWHVDCIDALEEVRPFLLANIKPSVPQENFTFTATTIEDYQLTQSYDLVIGYASLFFFEKKEDFDKTMGKALRAVSPGGRFMGVFFGLEHGWNPIRKLTYLCQEELQSYFHDFAIEQFKESKSTHSNGNPATLYHLFYITAKKHQ